METTALEMFTNTVKYVGNDIFIQPFCDFFQIDYLNQKKAINKSLILKKAVSKKTSISLFGDNFERIALTKQGFITWILQMRCQIVHPNLQEKLVQYQMLIFDYMFGTIQREENIRTVYARLNKLKRLKTKISTDINQCETEIQAYLNDRFVQTTLNFNDKKAIAANN